MKNQILINSDKFCLVQLTKGAYSVRLALWLADEFTGGDLVRFDSNATVSLEGTDSLSSSYSRANWLSGVTSGALYAFRTLRIPRQRVMLTDFSVRLSASEMDAVANGAAIAISNLADKELSTLEIEGWTIQRELLALVHKKDVNIRNGE